MKVKKQFAAVDIAKYISALLVVCIHTFPFLEISQSFNTYWIGTICRVAVPFFFTVSGYFFFKKWSESPEENLENLKAYLFRLLKLYLIWTLIYLPYTLFDLYKAGFSILGIIGYIRNFFLTGSYYHLWFLPSLIIGTVIVYWLYKEKGMISTLKYAFGLYIIGYLINVYAPIWESIPGISFLFAFFTKLFVTARNGFFFGPIFIALGLLLSKTARLPIKVSLTGFGVGFLGLILEMTLYSCLGIYRDLTCMYLLLVPTIYFLVNYLLKVKITYKPVYRELRNDSSLIYTSHILFSKPLLALMPNAHIVVYFLTLALAQGFASLVTHYKKQVPFLENLI